MKALEKARKERAAATKKAEQEVKQQQDAKKRALEDARKERAATKRKAEASVPTRPSQTDRDLSMHSRSLVRDLRSTDPSPGNTPLCKPLVL